MTTPRVIDRNEVSINSQYYRLKSPVRPFLASSFGTKQVTGDYTKDSEEIASTHAWSDWSGGLGQETAGLGQPNNQYNVGLGDPRIPGHYLLPPDFVDIGHTFGVPEVIGDLGSFIYASRGTSVRRWDNVSWSAALGAPLVLSGSATDILTIRLSDGAGSSTVWLVICNGTDVYYTSTGTTWYTDTTDVQFMAEWDGRLWGIDSAGILKSTALLSATPTDNVWDIHAQLPLQASSVTDLLQGIDSKGEAALYACTRVGVWIRDPDSNRWVRTQLQIPDIQNAGRGSAWWHNALYFPAGMSIWEYSPLTGTIRNLGLVMGKNGVPNAYRATVRRIVGTFSDLYVCTDGSGEAVTPTVMAWDETGWRVVFEGATSTDLVTMHATSTFNVYRLYLAYTSGIGRIALQTDRTNPKDISNYAYETPGNITTPWFDGGWENIDKVALRILVGTRDITVNETIQVQFAINDAASYTNLGTINTAGVTRTEYKFPDSVTPIGTVFRKIRFLVTLVRGATITNSPDLRYLSLVYLKVPTIVWGWAVELDLTRPYKNNSPMQQLANLVTAMESTTLVAFTFRDDTGNDRNFYVRAQRVEGVEQSGHDERAIYNLRLVALHELA